MRRLMILGAAAMLFLAALASGAAASGPPADVHIEGIGHSIPDGTGPFTATGPAVDDGIVCASGDVVDIFASAVGFSDAGFSIQVLKEFTCDDGTGSFFVKLQVRINHNGDNFNWVIVGGTGEYEDLRGAGSGIGINPTDTTIDDIYDGNRH